MQQQHSLSTFDDDDVANGFTDSNAAPAPLSPDNGSNFAIITPFLNHTRVNNHHRLHYITVIGRNKNDVNLNINGLYYARIFSYF